MTYNWSWIDKTRYEMLLTCERKFLWRHGRGFVEKSISPQLANGLAWHDAMDVFWRLVRWKGVSPLDAVDPAVATWAGRWAKESGSSSPRAETPTYNSARMRKVIGTYAETFDSRFSNFELIDIETQFRLDLGFVEARGRWDKPLLYLPDGKIWIGEHKTTSSYDKAKGDIAIQWEQKWELDPGTKFYAMVGWKKFGPDFGGVLVDGALFASSPVTLSVPIVHPESLLRSFEADLKLRIERLKRDEYAQQWSQCKAWGRSCEYLDLCNAGWEPEDAPVPDGMEINVWNPEDH